MTEEEVDKYIKDNFLGELIASCAKSTVQGMEIFARPGIVFTRRQKRMINRCRKSIIKTLGKEFGDKNE